MIKENGKIKMKEVFKDYGTLWKVELEPAKVNIQKILRDHHLIGYHVSDSDWLPPITNYYLLLNSKMRVFLHGIMIKSVIMIELCR